VLLTALLDFGCESRDDLLAPLSSPELEGLFTETMERPWRCNLEQSWLRKKFARLTLPALDTICRTGTRMALWAPASHYSPDP
jgi:hypothetical protein